MLDTGVGFRYCCLMQVCGQEFSRALIARINSTVQGEPMLSRRELSRRVCRWLDWRAPNGKLKDVSARVALQRLDQRGLIALAPASSPPPPRLLSTEPVASV